MGDLTSVYKRGFAGTGGVGVDRAEASTLEEFGIVALDSVERGFRPSKTGAIDADACVWMGLVDLL